MEQRASLAGVAEVKAHLQVRGMFIRKAQPDATLTNIETEYEPHAIPLVNQAVATRGQLDRRLRALEGEISLKLLSGFGSEGAMPLKELTEAHEDEVPVRCRR